MKITSKILSIPPYLSVNWSDIRALYVKDGSLIISLADGNSIPVPNLTEKEIETIFQAHSAFAGGAPAKTAHPQGPSQASLQFIQALQHPEKSTGQTDANAPFKMNIENMEAFGSAMQHNPSLGNIPSLPKEILDKIAAIIKIMAPGEIDSIPKAEPHCNCPHCQIARAVHGDAEQSSEIAHETPAQAEEVVTEEDLKFVQWEIKQIGQQMYSVTNKLDLSEQYQVFLGEPVGCTCGVNGCEHILAVLKS